MSNETCLNNGLCDTDRFQYQIGEHLCALWSLAQTFQSHVHLYLSRFGLDMVQNAFKINIFFCPICLFLQVAKG